MVGNDDDEGRSKIGREDFSAYKEIRVGSVTKQDQGAVEKRER